jgi:hypothetical protein
VVVAKTLPTPDEMRLIRVSVDVLTVAQLRIRLLAFEQVPLFDLYTMQAVLFAMWVRGRTSIEFLKGGSSGPVEVRRYLGDHRWGVPKPYSRRLDEYRTTITNYVVHHKLDPKGGTGMADALAADLVAVFELLLDEMDSHDDTRHWCEFLRSGVVQAQQLLAAPGLHFDVDRDLIVRTN